MNYFNYIRYCVNVNHSLTLLLYDTNTKSAKCRFSTTLLTALVTLQIKVLNTIYNVVNYGVLLRIYHLAVQSGSEH